MNLPSDLQRLLPYVAVAVLAVVGLFLVMRGIGSDEASVPPNPAPVERQDPAPANRGGGEGSGSGKETPAPAPKRSREAYVRCVEQATDTAALERCQAFLPRR
jgi:hypothetical protein